MVLAKGKKRLQFVISEDEAEAIRREAEARGRSISNYLNHLVGRRIRR